MKFNKKLYRLRIVFFKIISVIALCSILTMICYHLIKTPKIQEINNENKINSSYGLVISNSLFEGADKQGKNYQLTSKSLIKENDELYHLETIDGKYNLGYLDLDFRADKGKMNDNTKFLQLAHNIVIEYNGYLLMTNHMDIDLNKMYAKNNHEVSVLYNNSNIKADRFTLDADSGTIHFEGNVLTRFKISDF